MVSLPSFVWAHCLVRSRALDLTPQPDGSAQPQQPCGPFARVQCMLPLIDLCNHEAGGACTLTLRDGGQRGRWVQHAEQYCSSRLITVVRLALWGWC